jgi:large subunit ribosomal protein L10
MAVTKEKKRQIVSSLKAKLQKAVSVVFVNFRGLSVAKLIELRRKLKEQAANFTVVKKTLLRLVLEQEKVEGQLPELEDEVALACLESGSDDPIVAARGLREFEKKNKDSIRFLGGIFEGRYIDAESVERLSLIPTKPALYGQLVGLLSSPLRRLVIALDQISKK